MSDTPARDRRPSPELIAALKSALGPAGWLEAAVDLAPFLSDFRHLYHGASPLVARPDSVERVAAVVRLCAAEGVAIVPHGGNTSYCGGATPREGGTEIVLSLARLNRIRSVDAEGFAITLDAGCTLAAAEAAAAAAGRRLPLRLGSGGSCQIGGNLSTNAGGTEVLRYGMARELVLGLEVVLPDGRVLDQLKSLRKDNTGYDVKQLFLGAEGTLGVITGACLKLVSSPADYLTALVALEDLAAAVGLLGRIRERFGDALEAFEFIPLAAYQLLERHLPGSVRPFAAPHPGYALLELALPAAITGLAGAMQEFLAAEIEAGRLADASLAQSAAQRAGLWQLREQIPRAQSLEGASIKHDVALPLAALAPFATAAEQRLASLAPGARVIGYGHVGDGNLHFNLSPPAGTAAGSAAERDFLALAPRVNREIHELVAGFAGSFSAEHGIGRLKVAELERYEDPVALELMRRLKTALDPQGIMNPGKVLTDPGTGPAAARGEAPQSR